jgi:peptide/nickel transport system ATP-binding protein/oligopeptide transport system ATP-binding protein
VTETLLEARDLVKHFTVRGTAFRGGDDDVHAVDGVSLEVRSGETLGVVGESGCGKSTLGRLLVRLHEPTSGSVHFDGSDITTLSRRRLRPYRREMQMIFQDPYASLNPRKRVGQILGDPFEIHGGVSREKTRTRVRELLETVGLSPDHVNRYPHEFSGGQRQRIGVARALALQPKMIIADEPVSALDVSIQAQILNLLRDLQREYDLTLVLISHDLSVVRHMCDRVAVMYLGKMVEVADSDVLYAHPRHPYTGALLSAVPVPDPQLAARKQRAVPGGDVPSPTNPPPACRFHTRCPKMQQVCAEQEPLLELKGERDLTACHFPLTEEEAAERTGTSTTRA